MSYVNATTNLSVVVIGAGLGGLTLAQSLRRSGISVQVFERDKGPFERRQGYRLHLDEDAINATAEVLTPELYNVFKATSHWTEPYTTILKTDLSVIRRLRTQDDYGDKVWPDSVGSSAHANVDRGTLRQILLAGLEDTVRYGKTLTHYKSDNDGVVAYFADGTSVAGDLLVGADGIRSPVRRQRAPDHDTVDAGITAIYGRIPIDVVRSIAPKEVLQDIFTIAMDERKVFLGLGTVQFGLSPIEAVSKFAPGVPMIARSDYAVCIVGGRHQYFPEGLRKASSEELKEIAIGAIKTWPESSLSLLRAADVSDFFVVEMFTSVPFDLDAPTNVTLLGDAVHAMTPTLGRGANVAMRDGALLGRQVRRAAAGTLSLQEALSVYERDMLDYGFQVVREAAEMGQQRMAQNLLPKREGSPGSYCSS